MIFKSFTSFLLAGIVVSIAMTMPTGSAIAQDDEPLSEPQTERSTTGGVLGRFFGINSKGTPKLAPPKNKPRSEGLFSGGIFVPLKSLTRSNKANARSSDDSEFPEEPPRIARPKGPPLEPFKKVTGNRFREARNQDASDIDVQSFPSATTPLVPPPILTPQRQAESTARRADQSLSVARTTRSEPAATPREIPLSVPAVSVDGKSTSRRTSAEIVDTGISETFSPRNDANPRSNDRGLKPKSLTDITISESGSPSTSSQPTLSNRSNNTDSDASANDLNPTLLERNRVPSRTRPNTDLTAEGSSRKSASQGPNRMVSNPRESFVELPAPKKPSNDRRVERNAPERPGADRNPGAPSTLHHRNGDVSREMSIPKTRLIVNGPDALLVGQEGQYEIVAVNEGDEALKGLIVRIATPAHVQIENVVALEGAFQPDNDPQGEAILWELEHLPARSSKSLKATLKTAKPEHFALGVEWTVVPQSTTMAISAQQPQLQLALEGPSEVIYGKPQMYRLRVRNPGNADVKSVDVALTAESFGSNQSNIGDLPAGSERFVDVELTFQQSGIVPITATASSRISNLNASSAIEVAVRQAELVATWQGPSEFFAGSIADYDIVLTNVGSITAQSVICRVKIPAGADVVSMPHGSVRNGDAIRWDIKKLDPQEKQTYPLRLLLAELGDNPLVYSAECSMGVPTKAEMITNVDTIADLHLSVVDPIAPAPVGQPVIYEIIINNRGKKAASDVNVLAQFSEGIEPTRLEGHVGRVVPGQVIFDTIPSIAPNEKIVLRVIAQASEPGVHRFRAEVRSQGNEADILEESTRFLAGGKR